MVAMVETEKRKKSRRVLSAPGKPKVGSRAYKKWLADRRAAGIPIKPGQPPVYRPGHAEAARKLVELGANDFEIAQIFGVSPTTIMHWRVKHPEFAEALRFRDEHGTFADDRVKRSLLHKATGYSFHSEKIFCQDGVVTRVPVVEHVPPSDTAMIFYLKNRDRERWSDRREVVQDARVRVARITSDMSVEQAAEIYRQTLRGAEVEDLLPQEPRPPALVRPESVVQDAKVRGVVQDAKVRVARITSDMSVEQAAELCRLTLRGAEVEGGEDE
jgi:hypothetical protein